MVRVPGVLQVGVRLARERAVREVELAHERGVGQHFEDVRADELGRAGPQVGIAQLRPDIDADDVVPGLSQTARRPARPAAAVQRDLGRAHGLSWSAG